MAKEETPPLSPIIDLPTEASDPTHIDPRQLLFYSAPKQGKSTAVVGLGKLGTYLVIDTEGGHAYIKSVRKTVKNWRQYMDLLKAIREADKPYKYLVIDTVTGLDNKAFVGSLALYKYKKGAVGRAEKTETKDVMELEYGLGYYYQREAFKTLLTSAALSIPDDGCVIFVGHLKDGQVGKADELDEASSGHVNLTGALKDIACSRVDAVGMFRRRNYMDKSQGIITFKTSDVNSCGFRCPHLETGEPILITEQKDDGSIHVDWSKIFIDQ